MGYRFIFSQAAIDDLQGLDRAIAKRILQKVLWLARKQQPLLYVRRLSKPALGDVRFRIGDHRAIALVDEKQRRIIIVRVGHRREVYL